MTDWFDQGGSGSPVDVGKILEHGLTWSLLADVVQQGAMVSIGTTSDGGSLGVTVTLDGRWVRHYTREPEDLEVWLSGASEGVAEAVRRQTASPGGRQRRRRS